MCRSKAQGGRRCQGSKSKTSQNKNSPQKTDPAAKGIKRTKVYRVGTLTAPPEYFEDLEGILKDMDKFKPEGRQGRHGGIFASPDLASHGRWVLGMDYKTHEGALDSHEITVDANSTYVYNVSYYEKASSYQFSYGNESKRFEDAAKKFWDSGMTLAEWREWAEENNPEPGTWEIIMSPDSMISTKKLGNRTVVNNASEDWADDLQNLLFPNRRGR